MRASFVNDAHLRMLILVKHKSLSDIHSETESNGLKSIETIAFIEI